MGNQQVTGAVSGPGGAPPSSRRSGGALFADGVGGAQGDAAIMLGQCYLCYKEETHPVSSTEDELVYPSCCRNRNSACRACLLQWIYACMRCQRSRSCPFCRSMLYDRDNLKIYDVDELTYRWLIKNVWLCSYCGYMRMQVQSGSSDCLCKNAPVKDKYGRVNMMHTLRRPVVQQERQKIRDELYQECEDQNSYHVNMTAWLFLPDGTNRIMNQLSCQEFRSRRRKLVDKEYREQTLHETWLFLRRGADIKAMQHLVMKENSHVRAERLKRKMKAAELELQLRDLDMEIRDQVLHAAWLFLRRGADIKAMQHLVMKENSHVRAERLKRKTKAAELELQLRDQVLHAAWLFLRRGADIKAMEHLVKTNHNEVREKRLNRQMKWESTEQSLHAAWLYQRRGADTGALRRMVMIDDDTVSEKRLKRRINMADEVKRRQIEYDRWLLLCQDEWRIQELNRQKENMEYMIRVVETNNEKMMCSRFMFYQQKLEWKQRIQICKRRKEIQLEREERRYKCRNQSEQNLSWIFLPSGLDVKEMVQLSSRDDDGRRAHYGEGYNVMFPIYGGSPYSPELHGTSEHYVNEISYRAYFQEMENEYENICLTMKKWLRQCDRQVKMKRGGEGGGRKNPTKLMQKTRETRSRLNARWKKKERQCIMASGMKFVLNAS